MLLLVRVDWSPAFGPEPRFAGALWYPEHEESPGPQGLEPGLLFSCPPSLQQARDEEDDEHDEDDQNEHPLKGPRPVHQTLLTEMVPGPNSLPSE